MEAVTRGAADNHPHSRQGRHSAAQARRAVGSATVSTVRTPPRRLADQFWFAAHNDYGQLRLFRSALEYGLAAALLAELYGEGRVTFTGRHVQVITTLPPHDLVQRKVLNRITAEGHTATQVWLEFFAATAYDQVATRMEQFGLLAQQKTGLLRRRTTYLPTDMNTAAWSWARLSVRCRKGQDLTPFDRALAGLALATGLGGHLLDGAPNTATEFAHQQVQQLPVPLRDLLADLRTIVDRAVLSHRTIKR